MYDYPYPRGLQIVNTRPLSRPFWQNIDRIVISSSALSLSNQLHNILANEDLVIYDFKNPRIRWYNLTLEFLEEFHEIADLQMVITEEEKASYLDTGSQAIISYVWIP